MGLWRPTRRKKFCVCGCVIWKPASIFREVTHCASWEGAVMPLGNEVDVIQHLGKKNLFILLALSDHNRKVIEKTK